MVFDDDERILNQNGTDEVADLELGGSTEVKFFNKLIVPEVETPFKVLVELKGLGPDEGRLGVDLVTILDISGSMNKEDKITKTKLAVQFLLKKLSPADRLSVVTFNRKAERLCPLRQITENSRVEIADQVNALVARSSTNTQAGLKMALKILNDRTLSRRRRVAIMLMSDGIEDPESNAAGVPVGKVPVYTFGFGSDCDPEVLSEIAKKSDGGMFSPVLNVNNLTGAFSLCLAGLLNVVIDDLKLTLTPSDQSKISKVNAGNYAKSGGIDNVGSVSVSFGSLYDREARKILAELILPKVDKRLGLNVLKVFLEYKVGGKDTLETSNTTLNVTRDRKSAKPEAEEVVAEETRLATASSIKAARLLADAKRLEEARNKLVDAKTSVSDLNAILTAQLDQLLLLMASQETYETQGRAFALALEASHDSQRPVATGDPSQPGMFNTPLMDIFIKQAGLFDKDPETFHVPTTEEDMRAFILNKAEKAIGFIKNIATIVRHGK